MAKKFKDFTVRDQPTKRGIHKKSQNKNEKRQKSHHNVVGRYTSQCTCFKQFEVKSRRIFATSGPSSCGVLAQGRP